MAEQLTPVEAAVIAVREAVREGASEAEAYVAWSRGYRGHITSNTLGSLVASDDAGVGVRVTVGKRVGFAYASTLEPEHVREAARRAVRAARASKEDEYWKGLPEPSSSYPRPSGVYEPSLAAIAPEDVVERLVEAVEEAKGLGANIYRALLSVSRIEVAVANTNGVECTDTGTYAYTYVAVSMETPAGPSPAIYEVDASRTALPSLVRLLHRAVEKIKLLKAVVKLDKPERMPVVWTGYPLSELLEATLLMALSGDWVVRGRSPFANRVGERVLDERITIVDDGVMKAGFYTSSFDSEGVARRRTVLVEKGVLKGFIYDTYWARRAGLEESTGNAYRIGYTQPPHPWYSNVVIEPGSADLDELLEGRVAVIYQVQGAFASNPVTGEYSVQANPAVLYEGGEPKGWLKGVVVSGDLYEELRSRVAMVGGFQEQPEPGRYLPWIRVEGVTLTPKA